MKEMIEKSKGKNGELKKKKKLRWSRAFPVYPAGDERRDGPKRTVSPLARLESRKSVTSSASVICWSCK